MNLSQTLQAWGIAIRNLTLGGNLVSLSLIKHPRKMLEYMTETLFLYKTFMSRRGLPERNVDEVLPAHNVETVKLGNLKTGETWGAGRHLVDLTALSLMCQILKPKVVFEIGTMKGYFTYHFALNAPDDAKIYTLDLPKDGSASPKLKTNAKDEESIRLHKEVDAYCFTCDESISSKINCLFGDSAIFDFSPFYGKVDLFFIDGAHSYEYVRSDTDNAFKCCPPGSVIAWHDFGNCGINDHTKWILELSKEHEIYVVPHGSVAFMVVKES